MTMEAMTVCDAADECLICDECREAQARWAVCFEVVKKYQIDDDGDPEWDTGEVIQNENDPILMCGRCVKKHQM
jgi:hypothetical protein